MTNDPYGEFKDSGAHLTKVGWKHAQDLVTMGFPAEAAIKEAESFERVLLQGANTRKVIYEQRSA